MNNIKKLRGILCYTKEIFAKLVGTDISTLSKWESGEQEPNYDALKRLSMLFHVSPDFILGTGIFSKWEQIIEYCDAVIAYLQYLIPDRLMLPTYCSDKYFNVWLDTCVYYAPDEIEFARWCAFAVKEIDIYPTGEDPMGTKTADIAVEFTPEFSAIINAETARPVNPYINIVSYNTVDGTAYKYKEPIKKDGYLGCLLSSY